MNSCSTTVKTEDNVGDFTHHRVFKFGELRYRDIEEGDCHAFCDVFD